MEQQPIAVSCDWFSFSVLLCLSPKEQAEGIALNTPQGYTLKEYGGTNLYKRRFILFNEYGEKSLTLLTNPHSKIIKANSMFVEVANRLLYSDFSFVLDLLNSIHPYAFQSLSRFDVAADFNPSVQQLHIMQQLQDNTCYVTGKREGSMFHDYILRGDGVQQRVARCMSWGAKGSNIHWKMYNKTLEIYEVAADGRKWCTKPYIVDKWLTLGLDPSNVWRLEVSITSASGYEWRGEKLCWDAHAADFYTPFFWDIYGTRFIIRANQGHKNRGKDQVQPFLPNPTNIHQRLRDVEPRGTSYHTDHAVTLRAALKELERDEVKVFKPMATAWLQVAEQTILTAKLQQYFFNTYGQTWEQYKHNYLSSTEKK